MYGKGGRLVYKFVIVVLAVLIVVLAAAWGSYTNGAGGLPKEEYPDLSPVAELVKPVAGELEMQDYVIEDVGVVYKILPDQRLLVSPTPLHKRLAVYDPETGDYDWIIDQVKGEMRIGSADANSTHVAWVEIRPEKLQVQWEVRYVERETGIERVVRTGRSRIEPRMVSVFDNILAWNEVVDHANTYEERIVMVDLVTGEQKVLAVSKDATAMHFEGPRVYGSRVLWSEVWHEDRGLPQSDIYLYDRDTKQTERIVTGGFNQAPAIYREHVAYVRGEEVLLLDLATGKTYRVSNPEDQTRKLFPTVSDWGVGWISEDVQGRFFRFDTGEVEHIGPVANRGTLMGHQAVLWTVPQPLGEDRRQVFHLRVWQ